MNLRTLDALRGMLAVYILLGHARWLLWGGHSAWVASAPSWWEYPFAYVSASLRYGHEIVMVFFVLSGFFIHLPVARDLAARGFGRLGIRDFARRRAMRLVPAYLFALLITFVIDMLGSNAFPTLYEARTGDSLLDSNFAIKIYSAASVIPAFFMMPGGFGLDFGTNGPLWSLGFEMVYYAAYPLWLWVRRRSLFLAYGAIPMASLLLYQVLPGSFLLAVLGHWPIWIAGAALCELLSRRLVPFCPVLVGTSLAIAGFLLFVSRPANPLFMLAYAGFGTGIVLIAASMSTSVLRFAPVRFLEWLGIRSYSIYILHFPFLAIGAAWAMSHPEGRPLHGWFALGGGLTTLILCCIGFELCEKRFLRRRIVALRDLPG